MHTLQNKEILRLNGDPIPSAADATAVTRVFDVLVIAFENFKSPEKGIDFGIFEIGSKLARTKESSIELTKTELKKVEEVLKGTNSQFMDYVLAQVQNEVDEALRNSKQETNE